MKIFISHKREDLRHAQDVAKILTKNRIGFYLDEMDSDLENSPDLTSHFIKQIESSTHLIAVITRNTIQSWWVPFEIGAASAQAKKITTFQASYTSGIPDYLKKWPILHTQLDIEKYAMQAIAQDSEDHMIFDSVNGISLESHRESSADAFHRKLKTILGQ